MAVKFIVSEDYGYRRNVLEAYLSPMLAHPHIIHTYTISAASSEWLLLGGGDEGAAAADEMCRGGGDCRLQPIIPLAPSKEDMEVEELLSGVSFHEIRDLFPSCRNSSETTNRSPPSKSGGLMLRARSCGDLLRRGLVDKVPTILGTPPAVVDKGAPDGLSGVDLSYHSPMLPRVMSRTRLSRSTNGLSNTNCQSNLQSGSGCQVRGHAIFYPFLSC